MFEWYDTDEHDNNSNILQAQISQLQGKIMILMFDFLLFFFFTTFNSLLVSPSFTSYFDHKSIDSICVGQSFNAFRVFENHILWTSFLCGQL